MISSCSYIFVFIQFTCLIILGFTGPLIIRNSYFLLMEIAAILLGIWAILIMRAGRLNIFPEILPGAQLIIKGPYRWIRHPMYLAVMLLALSLVLGHFTLLRMCVLFILVFNMLLKIHYEEKLLILKFTAYKEYIGNTRKLIPYIY